MRPSSLRHVAKLRVPLCVGGVTCFPAAWSGALTALLSPSSAAAAFLVSLYIKDIWLGAQQPDTLVTHVQMICDAAEEAFSGDQEAVVVLCRDIAALPPTRAALLAGACTGHAVCIDSVS